MYNDPSFDPPWPVRSHAPAVAIVVASIIAAVFCLMVI